ncbi:MAG: molybdenum cofactor guanylyltransferase [Dehalococcoidia bacterium]|nr:molybdenum cofactor guanylyltransferase [Dehalococcoidia bacterium]
MEISSIVLAGGKSLRLGRDKVFETVGGRNLLDLVIDRVTPLSRETILVTASNNVMVKSDNYSGLKTVTDIYPGRGPLGGVYTGLITSSSFCNLVVASDMPFLNTALLRYMMKVLADFDLVVPRMGNLVEPLHAIYTKNCLEPMEHLLKQDKLPIHRLFPMARTRYLEADEIEPFDPEHLSFFNINTRADLLKAEEIARGMKR